MSRTYRRKNQEQAFWSVKRHREESYWSKRYIQYLGVPKDKDPYQVWLKKIFHSDKPFAMRNPGWWNRLYGTKPLRAKTRESIHRTMKLIDIEDYPVFYERMRVPYYW